jgi:Domain of unknown function (DUF4404)
MDRQRVLAALDVLRGELAGSAQLSDESRASLERVTDDIRKLMEQTDAPVDPEGPTASGLHDALLEFETEHPHLTGALNQVAAALANLGI